MLLIRLLIAQMPQMAKSEMRPSTLEPTARTMMKVSLLMSLYLVVVVRAVVDVVVAVEPAVVVVVVVVVVASGVVLADSKVLLIVGLISMPLFNTVVDIKIVVVSALSSSS